MNINGNKVLLRAIEPSDNELLVSIINDPEIEYMLGGWSFPVSLKNQEEWTNALKYNQNTLRCIIQLEKENIAIGVIMLTDIDYKNGNAEIHIKLVNNEIRGKGYGSDAVNTLVKYAFDELRLKLIFSRVNEYNELSKRMFIKCGFEIEGILKKRLFKCGKYFDVVSLSKSAGNFE